MKFQSIIVFFAVFNLVLSKWVSKMENKHLFEGDMKLDPEEMSGLNNKFASSIGRLWPNKIVPFEIMGIGAKEKQNITKAIEEYHKHTCLRFVERKREFPYVYFYPGTGCSSPVGYSSNRLNDIALSDGCYNIGTIMHEIGHTIGLFHEQSRPDRDSYIKINWNNIEPGKDLNFKIQTINNVDSLGTPYDYLSIMHYPSTAFGGDKITISTIDKTMQNLIGNRNGFSDIDIKQINILYSCPGYSKCQDYDNNCVKKANAGECTKNATYMSIYCAKSCNKCKA
ncbi:zinc metalloproteinase nas-4 isoform X1 [Hydra vulgaris]|uniref:zinc metalloproteinase nas-4 isoform X1 n=1 Tax=Hydra vulgaris TaxID=6087 RepID=UPI0001924944|nr:zinc metalloproteinase nas-4 [Hydra vulgaris]